jgi:hypothetical protein
VVGCCEYGNEPSGSLNVGEFLDYLSVLFAPQGPRSIELVVIILPVHFMYVKPGLST